MIRIVKGTLEMQQRSLFAIISVRMQRKWYGHRYIFPIKMWKLFEII